MRSKSTEFCHLTNLLEITMPPPGTPHMHTQQRENNPPLPHGEHTHITQAATTTTTRDKFHVQFNKAVS